jgi:hypothetical protein
MTAIERSSQLLAFLRSRVAEAQPVDAPNKPAGQPADARGPSAPSEPQTLELLQTRIKQQLLQELRKLDKADPQLPAKAFRLFMSAVLKQQFPPLAGQAAELSRLVEQVTAQMESDPELGPAMKDAAAHLVKNANAVA